MLTIDRWRKWRPLDEKSNESLGCEPPKPSEPTFEGFEGFTSRQIQNFSDILPDHDPAAWREDFARWMAESCIQREGRDDWGGIGCLLVDFAEWCIAHEAVPCQRTLFETLLEEAGFRCADGMAAGIVLKVDMEAVLRFQTAPEGRETPESVTAIERRKVSPALNLSIFESLATRRGTSIGFEAGR